MYFAHLFDRSPWWGSRRRCKARHAGTFLSCLIVAIGHGTIGATTIVPVSFSDMVRASESIVVASVVHSSTSLIETPGVPGPGRSANSQATRVPLEGRPDTATTDGGPTPLPQPVGMKPGRVIFTHLTLLVEQTIKGPQTSPSGELYLTMPGGTYAGITLSIAGLPEFAVGERYVLFLSPGFARLGDPVVGVNQGFFRVATEAGGGSPMLIDHAGNRVVGVSDDRIVVLDGRETAAAQGKQREPLALTPDGLAALVRAVPDWDAVRPIPGRKLRTPAAAIPASRR